MYLRSSYFLFICALLHRRHCNYSMICRFQLWWFSRALLTLILLAPCILESCMKIKRYWKILFSHFFVVSRPLLKLLSFSKWKESKKSNLLGPLPKDRIKFIQHSNKILKNQPKRHLNLVLNSVFIVYVEHTLFAWFS